MRLALLGPPGSGKGTQARILAGRLGLLHISTGDMFRRAIDEGSQLGKQVRKYVESGALVPDELVIAVGNERLAEDDCRNGFLLDGLPRTLPQARALGEFLGRRGLLLDAVLYFQVGEAEVVKRLSGRRICQDCGANYHTEFVPPKRPGVCDQCGAKLHQRADDVPERVVKRLRVYDEEIHPLLEYYRQDGMLKVVRASSSVEDTAAEVVAVLGLTAS